LFVVDWGSLGPALVSVGAIVFAALTWLESRKQRQLLETVVKTLPYVSGRRRTTAKKRVLDPTRPVPQSKGTVPVVDPIKSAAEERRRLRLELERERLEWRKNRDIAKAIGWLLDRMGESEDNYDDG
jgi:hypothetical protein